MQSRGSNHRLSSMGNNRSRIPALLISMFATFASIYVVGRLWQDAENRVYLIKELDRITGQGQSAISVDDTLKIIACREQHKKLDALETELAAARQEGFVSKPLIEINGTYSRRRPLVVIGILTKFGRQKNRDAIRKAWMGSGSSLKKIEDGKGIIVRFVIGRSENRGDNLDADIARENRLTNDFIILDNHVETNDALPKKAKLFFAHAADKWDAEFYAKVNDDIYVNIDALGATLATHLDKPRVYMGCMKSGEVFSELNHKWYEPEWWKFGDKKSYFRHASGEMYVISRALAKFISITEVKRQLRWSYSHIVEEFIVGLDKDIEKVAEWLLNENMGYRFVYICGMGGLGKTTLAKSIYHYNAIRRNFDGFAWAYISQQCKKRDVWEGILLKLISPTKEERDEITKMKDDELARKLFKVQQEKKCLIILDDIWSNEAWDILSPAFPSQNTRSKIVFTSRNKDISLHVNPEGLLHEPSCLNADDSWALFKKKAFPRQDDPESTTSDDFKRLGREMVAKCAGLPLAIIVLGGLLATKESVNEWEKIHRHLSSYLIGAEVRDRRRLDEVLDLSYQDLPCQLKPCFLYLSQFPEDSEIPKTKLLQLWVAEGVVPSQYESERDETMEDVAERYLGNLISRCMVQIGQMGSTGRIKTYRLHDLMRDLCLSKARKENFLYIINGSQESTIDATHSSNVSDARRIDEVRRLAVYLDQHVDQLIPQDKQVNQYLRSLVFFHDKKCRMENWDLVRGVFVKFKLLRVLDLEGIKGLKGQSLPKEVGNLLWLKFLSLKRTRIQVLPSSLGNLENLQFLNLQTVNKVSWDSTVEIPNVICKLKRLRHLYLPNWCGNIANNLQLENLTNLQTLVNFPASKCDVKDLLKLKKLRKLVLNDPRHFQKFSESFSPPNKRLDCLQSLSLRTDMLSFPENVVDVEKLVLGCPSLRKLQVEGRMERLPDASLFPPQLSKLTLWGCRLVEDPMVTLEKLPNLKFLNGWDMFVGKKMACTRNGFPQLKVIILRGLPNLDEWTIENEAMPSLYRLSISDCNNLKTIPDGLKYVTSLRELEIRWMPKSFKTRLGTAGEDYHKVQHVPSIVFLN